MSHYNLHADYSSQLVRSKRNYRSTNKIPKNIHSQNMNSYVHQIFNEKNNLTTSGLKTTGHGYLQQQEIYIYIYIYIQFRVLGNFD